MLAWSATGSAVAPSQRAVTGSRELQFLFRLTDDRTQDRMMLAAPPLSAPPAGHRFADTFEAAVLLSTAAAQELLGDERTPGAGAVREFLAAPAAPPVSLPLSPVARLALESIRRCPFVGACRAMALTARCNDLLIDFLDTLARAGSPRPPAPTRTMQEQIRAAADLLDAQLENPPTLGHLARTVGLSETTLKRGFHQVFGAPVFAYLRARRMERARALLQAGEATVLEAAACVGYSNPSNFSSAFRRHFGVNPKQYQLTSRR